VKKPFDPPGSTLRSSPSEPRERARLRLAALRGGAALLVSAAVGPANAGCDVVPSPPPNTTPSCTATGEDASAWLFASVSSGDPISVLLSLNSGEVDLELANVFTVTGGTLQGDPVFDRASLALSRNVSLTIVPDDGATDITIETGVTCGSDPRSVRFTFNLADLNANGSAFPTGEDITPP
jgi:hypothetical protein